MTRGPDPSHTKVDILRQFIETPDPVLFVSEVSEYFDKSDEWARGRMNELVEDGYLDSKKPGRRTRVYWITREGREYYASTSASDNQ
ncbi:MULTISPECIES: hypothetical protein [Halobaculum]|uniref:MarR family transcriptional regulator n=1 Tax=Halobaculum roseum TaxID=2175149 RepID=A0ABD5MNX2_9EURY|nr:MULTISPECIES: hypothetical protein [Halobaculum]QZY01197.1 hypothetical protein K6T25_15150 [Halobaculum rubrum]QZY04240.1 hypothetical protein K6T36_16135 [Halobaculum roseum]